MIKIIIETDSKNDTLIFETHQSTEVIPGWKISAFSQRCSED